MMPPHAPGGGPIRDPVIGVLFSGDRGGILALLLPLMINGTGPLATVGLRGG
jgi:hypothetical protein